MQSAAFKSQRIVFGAAEPTYVGEKIKRQKERSFHRLRLHEVPAGDSVLHNAWNGRAGAPTLEILEIQAQKVGVVVPPFAHEVMTEIQKNIERLRAIDAEFHRPQIEFYCAEIERLARLFAQR